MSRPPKHNLDYFPHDNNMRNDKKLKAARAKYGLDGYAIHNMLLETIAESNLLVLKWDAIEVEMIAGDFGMESEKLEEVVNYFSKINLIKKVNGYVYCPQLDRRSEMVFAKRTQFLTRLRSEEGVSVSETRVSVSETTQRKGKERKEKKSKEKKELFAENVKMEKVEFETLVERFGEERTGRMIEILDNYKGAKGKTYKSDYRAILSWVVGEEKKRNPESDWIDGLKQAFEEEKNEAV